MSGISRGVDRIEVLLRMRCTTQAWTVAWGQAFVAVAEPQAQHVLAAIDVDAERDVDGPVDHDVAVTDLHHDDV